MDGISLENLKYALEKWTDAYHAPYATQDERENAGQVVLSLQGEIEAMEKIAEAKRAKVRARAQKARLARLAILDAADSVGVVRVRGARGGTYWE